MEIFHLRYFVAVADELSFTRAAAHLRMATSPLSRRVRDLERELGAPLFERSHHGVSLTPAGAALLPLARDVLARFDALPAKLRRRAGGVQRTAVVGMAPDVGPEIRDAFLAALRVRHPDLTVAIRPDNTGPLINAVRAGALDLAFVHGRVAGAALTSVRVDARPAGVAVAAGTGFDGRTEVHLEELVDLPYVSISHDSAPSLYRKTDELLVRCGVVRRIELDSHNPGDLAHVVAAGQAFTFVGLETGATHKAFVGEPVVILPVAGTEIRLTTDAVWRTDRAVDDDVVVDLAEVAAALPRGTR